jgi:AraC-like DNA-binding protein
MLIGARTFRRLVHARELLATDTDDTLTVRAVAEQVGLSPFHFIRQFAAVYGTTPHQLRTRERLDRAKALLAAGTPVTEVCMEVGFSSLGSFSALFTRWVGASPTRYRRSVQVPRSIAPLVHGGGCFGLLAQLPARNSREAIRV